MKKIMRKFHNHNAISQETALMKEELGIRAHFIFNRLISKNIIISAGDNKFYLDIVAEEDHFMRIRQRMFFVLLIIFVLLIMLAITNNL